MLGGKEQTKSGEQSPSLPVQILELRALTEVKGRVYEQLVIGKVDFGQVIAIFDFTAEVPREFLASRCSFSLLAFLPVIEHVSEEKCEIESWDESVVPRIHNRAFTGKVIGFEGDDIILDLGCGTILVSYRSQDHHVAVGWYVRIRDFRLDIIGDVGLRVLKI